MQEDHDLSSGRDSTMFLPTNSPCQAVPNAAAHLPASSGHCQASKQQSVTKDNRRSFKSAFGYAQILSQNLWHYCSVAGASHAVKSVACQNETTGLPFTMEICDPSTAALPNLNVHRSTSTMQVQPQIPQRPKRSSIGGKPAVQSSSQCSSAIHVLVPISDARP